MSMIAILTIADAVIDAGMGFVLWRLWRVARRMEDHRG